MTPRALKARIRPLPEAVPRHRDQEQAIGVGVGFANAWYRSQKQHWMGWLGEYDGLGAYGRQTGQPRDARYAYNHIQCAPMLFWLAEALNADAAQLDKAYAAVLDAKPRGAAQCGALRRVLPWADIAALLDA